MRARLYHVDAFTTRNFSGHPAAGVVLAAYPSSEVMQAVAAENNLPETAFIVPGAAEFRHPVVHSDG